MHGMSRGASGKGKVDVAACHVCGKQLHTHSITHAPAFAAGFVCQSCILGKHQPPAGKLARANKALHRIFKLHINAKAGDAGNDACKAHAQKAAHIFGLITFLYIPLRRGGGLLAPAGALGRALCRLRRVLLRLFACAQRAEGPVHADVRVAADG